MPDIQPNKGDAIAVKIGPQELYAEIGNKATDNSSWEIILTGEPVFIAKVSIKDYAWSYENKAWVRQMVPGEGEKRGRALMPGDGYQPRRTLSLKTGVLTADPTPPQLGPTGGKYAQ